MCIRDRGFPVHFSYWENFILKAKVELHKLTNFCPYICSDFEYYQNKICHGCLNDIFHDGVPKFLRFPHYFLLFKYQKFDHVIQNILWNLFIWFTSCNNVPEHFFILPAQQLSKQNRQFLEFSPECYFNLKLLLHYELSTKLLSNLMSIWIISALNTF